MPLRRRTFEVLETARPGDLPSQLVGAVLMALILANVVAVVLESVPRYAQQWGPQFLGFERVSLAVFGVEYVLRLWSCTSDPRFAHPVRGRLAFALQPLVLVDLLAILPGLVDATAGDLRALRSLRLLRLLRVLKLTRYSTSLQVFARVLVGRAPELLSTLFVMLLLLTMASSLMYHVERDANPAFGSIPDAMWWGVATLTTVGYGDITPITPLGRLLGSAVAVLGIGMFAIPAGLLGAAFTEEMARVRAGQSAAEPPQPRGIA